MAVPLARSARAQVIQQSAGSVSWEIAMRAPSTALRPFIYDFCGYCERAAPGLVRRTEFPGAKVVVIFDFGPPIVVRDNRDGHRPCRFPDGFVAGLDDRYSITEHQGFQRGLQLSLTPLGARLFFDRPMSEIAGRVVQVADLLPRAHRCATEQLESLPGWDARFDFIEQLVADRVGRAQTLNPAIVWAYQQIQRSGGKIEMRGLARALGYSRTHLIALFRDQVGFPPKVVARITRFDRLIRHLKAQRGGTWADLAVEFGYYDQAHLVREMRQFAGMTPTQARAAAIEVPGGAALEELHSAQEAELQLA